jgi:hypothetical protein
VAAEVGQVGGVRLEFVALGVPPGPRHPRP